MKAWVGGGLEGGLEGSRPRSRTTGDVLPCVAWVPAPLRQPLRAQAGNDRQLNPSRPANYLSRCYVQATRTYLGSPLNLNLPTYIRYFCVMSGQATRRVLLLRYQVGKHHSTCTWRTYLTYSVQQSVNGLRAFPVYFQFISGQRAFVTPQDRIPSLLRA